MGEGFEDDALLSCVSSVNIACGGHAGDDETMRDVVIAARRHNLAIGAHPSWEDPEYFGRRELAHPPEIAESMVAAQIRRLARIATLEGVTLTHVKPHGALYNQAAKDLALARAIAQAVASVDARLMLVGLDGSALLVAARGVGLRAVREAFVDREYRSDGSLAPRNTPNAVVRDPEAAARRAVALARGEAIRSIDGGTLHLEPQTLCLHGDTPDAVPLARAVRTALDDAGIVVRFIHQKIRSAKRHEHVGTEQR